MSDYHTARHYIWILFLRVFVNLFNIETVVQLLMQPHVADHYRQFVKSFSECNNLFSLGICVNNCLFGL